MAALNLSSAVDLSKWRAIYRKHGAAWNYDDDDDDDDVDDDELLNGAGCLAEVKDDDDGDDNEGDGERENNDDDTDVEQAGASDEDLPADVDIVDDLPTTMAVFEETLEDDASFARLGRWERVGRWEARLKSRVEAGDNVRVVSTLKELWRATLTAEELRTSRLPRQVGALRRHADKNVVVLAKSLVARWKELDSAESVARRRERSRDLQAAEHAALPPHKRRRVAMTNVSARGGASVYAKAAYTRISAPPEQLPVARQQQDPNGQRASQAIFSKPSSRYDHLIKKQNIAVLPGEGDQEARAADASASNAVSFTDEAGAAQQDTWTGDASSMSAVSEDCGTASSPTSADLAMDEPRDPGDAGPGLSQGQKRRLRRKKCEAAGDFEHSSKSNRRMKKRALLAALALDINAQVPADVDASGTGEPHLPAATQQ